MKKIDRSKAGTPFKAYFNLDKPDHFVWVRVYKNRKSMCAAVSRTMGSTYGSGYAGLCMAYRLFKFPKGSKRALASKELGTIFLNYDEARAAVVTHECLHAVAAYAKLKRLNLCRTGVKAGLMSPKCDQERLCYALGDLVYQIGQKVWD